MIQFDKILHFLFSLIIAIYNPLISFFAGIGKELLDSLLGGVADVYDLLADWAGIALAEIIRFLLL
jgi:hypothetical protein